MRLKEYKIEVDYEPHSGVYSIELNNEWSIYFAPKENLDLSGWSISSNNYGNIAGYVEDWENTSYDEIEKDINLLYKIRPNYTNKFMTNEIIDTIKEYCLENSDIKSMKESVFSLRNLKKMIDEIEVGETVFINAIQLDKNGIDYLKTLVENEILLPTEKSLNIVVPSVRDEYLFGKSILPQADYIKMK